MREGGGELLLRIILPIFAFTLRKKRNSRLGRKAAVLALEFVNRKVI